MTVTAEFSQVTRDALTKSIPDAHMYSEVVKLLNATVCAVFQRPFTLHIYLFICVTSLKWCHQ